MSSQNTEAEIAAEKNLLNEGQRRRVERKGCVKICQNNKLIVLTFVGVICGFALGFGVRELELTEDGLTWIGKSTVTVVLRLQLWIIIVLHVTLEKKIIRTDCNFI